MNGWRGKNGPLMWRIGDTLYISVVFTWDLPKAKAIIEGTKKKVIVGGPAVRLMPEYLRGGAEMPDKLPSFFPEPITGHNPLATFTTRGCPNCCPFCAVPIIEGEFRELSLWRPAPVICDNNLLASSEAHFHNVTEALRGFTHVDFNQGLDADLFTDWHASELRRLHRVKVRFSWDETSQEKAVYAAILRAREHGLTDLGVYCLIGFKDTPQDAQYRLEKVREWGIWPNPMRYQPLDALEKNAYVAPGWTKDELRNMERYYSRLRYLEHVPFEEYKYGQDEQERLW